MCLLFEPCCKKTGFRWFRPDPTQNGLYSYRRCMTRCLNFFSEVEDFYTSYEVKTKAPATAKLICVFVFAYAKSRFSHDQANLVF